VFRSLCVVDELYKELSQHIHSSNVLSGIAEISKEYAQNNQLGYAVSSRKNIA